MKQWLKTSVGIGAISIALLMTGCTAAAPSEDQAALSTADAVELVGGQENYDRLMELYTSAVDAGQTTVTIYGPEAEAETATVQDAWAALFPEIKLVGVQINGASLAERTAAEAQTGKGAGDVVISGSADILTVQEQLTDFAPFTGTEIGADYRGPKGTVASALMPFAFVYNTDAVESSDVPTVWSEALTSRWADGALSIPDPTNPGAQFHALNTLLYQGVWTEDDIRALAAQDPTIVPGTVINGPLTNTAQGQSQGAFFVTTTTAEEAIGRGAKVALAFPMAENNIMIPEYLGLLGSAPSPIAAELYGNWRLTRSGADAVAEYGFYSLVDGSQAPEGLPALEEIDVLPEVPFDELLPSYGNSMPLLRSVFGG